MPVVMAIIGYLFLAYCAWALCKAAGDADRQAEKEYKPGRAE